MKRRPSTSLWLPVGALLLCAQVPVLLRAAEPTPRKPNIIILLADDLGYADVGFHGCRDIPTPHIDALATGGVRCTSGYVSAPVCSPMRAGLMTGRYQQRFGYEFNPGPARQASERFGLPLDETTLPQRLKKAGYVTGMVGKWHLGLTERLHPLNRGFDAFFGFLHGSHSYVDAKADPLNPILRGFDPVDEQAYLTDAFNREAVAFIERNRDKPFFLYLSYNAVHGPLQAPRELIERFDGIKDPRRRTYAAMVTAMDDGIGQVMDALKEFDIQRNTLVFFLSDNGGPPHANASCNDPLRGTKGTVYEGGIRVPFVVYWEGRLPKGRAYDLPVISLDIFATAAAAAGAPTGDLELDGVDLLPHLTGRQAKPPHEALFWRIGSRCAIRTGQMKLLRNGDEPWALYDLAADIDESKNLADVDRKTLDSMRRRFETWNGRLSEPRWQPVRRDRRATGRREGRR